MAFFKAFIGISKKMPGGDDKMSRTAVICEFNPFHNGHKFLLENIKSGDIVCIMSGNFVQRGDIAVTDKYARTAAALENGADLVAELPTVYAMAPAHIFAKAGVRLAYELGCDRLCFGSENSIEELYTLLECLDREETQRKIAAAMKAGDYYPRALSEAVGEAYAEAVSKPNNILALEYIRACRAYGIEPAAIPRRGVDHDSDTVCSEIASATKLRAMIADGEDYASYTPMTVRFPANIGAIESAVLYRLKTMTADELAALPDVNEGLENRIIDAAKMNHSYSEILAQLKTKRYTMARLRRILLCALLGITREMQEAPVPYARILGVKAEKKHLIHTRTLPLIVDVKNGYDKLENSSKEIFNIDLHAAALMNIASQHTTNEFSQGLITV